MAAQIPTHATGDYLASGDWNTLTPLNNSIGVLNGSAQSGTLPATTAPNFQVQGGSTVVNTNGSGGITINFPTAFPAGLLTVIAGVGDNAGSMGQVQLLHSFVSKTGFSANCFTVAGAAIVSLGVRINWIAIGF